MAVHSSDTEVPASDRDFRPERSDLIELGGKMDLMDDRVGLTAALFQIEKRTSYDVDPTTGDHHRLQRQWREPSHPRS